MQLDQLIPPGTRREALLLRIGDTRFEAREIESCVVILQDGGQKVALS